MKHIECTSINIINEDKTSQIALSANDDGPYMIMSKKDEGCLKMWILNGGPAILLCDKEREQMQLCCINGTNTITIYEASGKPSLKIVKRADSPRISITRYQDGQPIIDHD
jgi:hypothetical protein